jgi:chitinase
MARQLHKPATVACSPSGTKPLFSAYKDITINLDWNTNVLSTMVTGTRQSLTSVMPAKLGAISLAFATGECGSETWAGLGGPAFASANVQKLVAAGKKYILSTGGAAGSFTCGSAAGFNTFINRYNSANLIGERATGHTEQRGTCVRKLSLPMPGAGCSFIALA